MKSTIERASAVSKQDALRCEGPLQGLRVVELGSYIAGPFCTRLMGDFGANVIKVELPGDGDPFRGWGRGVVAGQSVWWLVQSRNKRCITLDLRRSEGRELGLRLIDHADVVV